MKALIVGGTGMIGGYIALRLREEGHQVTLAARHPVPAGSPLEGFDFLPGSYIDEAFTRGQLEGYDTLVFTAGNDIRQVPRGLNKAAQDGFYRRANSEGVPRFFALAHAAGIRRAAYVGSFYPQARPDLVGPSGYIRSRLDADEGARALAGPDFHVVSLNAPFVIGMLPGLAPANCQAMAQWALGRKDLPLHAARGGVNFISFQSLYEAVRGGLAHGENGRGYLVGDENLHFAEYFELYFRAAGRRVEFSVRDEPMPMIPDSSLFAGRNGTIFYDPDGVETLGYRRHDMARTVGEIVEFARNAEQ
jgi:dihydroflavonol-4-reductase